MNNGFNHTNNNDFSCFAPQYEPHYGVSEFNKFVTLHPLKVESAWYCLSWDPFLLKTASMPGLLHEAFMGNLKERRVTNR